MDFEDVQGWLDRYLEAWRTYEPAKIGSLFSDAATYAYWPWAEPVRGRDAIVASWLADQDAPGSWEAEYRPVAVDGDVAVTVGETRYSNGKAYSNAFVLRFDERNRCVEFTEYFMARPEG